MSDDPAVRTSGLRKSYGGLTVLDGLDLAVARGSVFALLGPNGAGKTTTVRILATLVRADAGTATVAGYDIVRQRSLVRRHISVTGQDVALDELQTGAENLRMMGRLSGLNRPQATKRAAELLERFDLADVGRRRVGTYSGGLRRRLDLAAGLVGAPSVVFLDEPTTGLDPRSRQAMWQVVTELTGAGVTVFLTTQYLEEADQLADRIVVMDAGRMVADGTATELKRRYADQRLDLTLVDSAAYDAVLGSAGDAIVHSDRSRLTLGLATDGTAAHIRRLLDTTDPHRTAVASFAVHTATLDDVFLALTGHSVADSVADSVAGSAAHSVVPKETADV